MSKRTGTKVIRVVLLLAVCLIALPLSMLGPKLTEAAGTIYYFSTSGNDASSGTSPSSPKRSIGTAISLMNAGNSILFKRGDTWYNASLNLSNKAGTATNPIKIGAYGAGPQPVIAAMDFLADGGWAPDTAGRWKYAIGGGFTALRLFENGVSKRLVASASLVDQRYEWAMAAGYIYVYTGSLAPGAGPKGVETVPSGGNPALQMKNTNYINISDIDFRGGTTHHIARIHSPSSHISIDSSTFQRGNHSGIMAGYSGSGDATSYVSNINLTNNLIDKVWTSHESYAGAVMTGDGIIFAHAVNGGLIKGNKIINWGHGGISLTTYEVGAHGVHNIIVELNDVSKGNSGYMHGIDMNGFTGKTTNNIIRRNYFHDYSVTGHILGNSNRVYSNIFAGVTHSTLNSSITNQPWGVDWEPWEFKKNGVPTGNWIVAKDNYLVNNTIADTGTFGVSAGPGNNPGDAADNKIINNLFYNYGKDSPDPKAIRVASTSSDTIYIRNNTFYRSGTANVAQFRSSGTVTAGGLDIACATCSANSSANPNFVNPALRDYRLQSSSPADVLTGGNTAYAAYMGTGFVDYYGRAWHSTLPSRGAIQYTTTNPVNVAAGIKPTFSTHSDDGNPSRLTNGVKTTGDYIGVGGNGDIVYAQLDLGSNYEIGSVNMWHYPNGRTFRDVIVQISETADFSSRVHTVFNNDSDNSAGLGFGSDKEYPETSLGQTVRFAPVTGRYVRFWIGGNDENAYNQFTEVEVYTY